VPNMDLIGWLVVGLVAGWLSGMVVPVRAVQGCFPTLLIGVLGGLFGGYLARELHLGDPSGFLGAVVVAFVGAVIVRVIIGAVTGPQKA
jgi:uncharacterized membrane protein YeaQ/YmgE (transglycosylase-associated protein family)